MAPYLIDEKCAKTNNNPYHFEFRRINVTQNTVHTNKRRLVQLLGAEYNKRMKCETVFYIFVVLRLKASWAHTHRQYILSVYRIWIFTYTNMRCECCFTVCFILLFLCFFSVAASSMCFSWLLWLFSDAIKKTQNESTCISLPPRSYPYLIQSFLNSFFGYFLLHSSLLNAILNWIFKLIFHECASTRVSQTSFVPFVRNLHFACACVCMCEFTFWNTRHYNEDHRNWKHAQHKVNGWMFGQSIVLLFHYLL